MNTYIKGSTRLIGLLGNPVKHSKSPHMHNLCFEKLGLDYVYMAFGIQDNLIGKSVDAMRILNFKGFNVTMPHKQRVMDFLDEISEDAKIIGSVNTVVNNNGRLIGYNTDGRGFVKALEEEGQGFKDEKIIIIGAGGASKSISIQLAFDGAREVVLFNRTTHKAQEISDIINKEMPNSKARALELDEKILKKELKDSKVLINATSIGMKDTIDKSVITSPNILHKDLFVADIIYAPSKTKFLFQAEEVGCRTMNGTSMLLYQGALAFKMWTGKDMPIEDVKERIF